MRKLLLVALCATALPAVPAQARPAPSRAALLTPTAAAGLAEGGLRVRVTTSRSLRTRVAIRVGRTWVVRGRVLRLVPGRAQALELPLTSRGRRALGTCGPREVVVELGRGRGRRVVARRVLAPARSCAPPSDVLPDGRRRVLFSTDFTPGLVGPLPASPYPSDVDDGIAVALALNAKALRVDGLAIQFGNNEAEPSTRVAREMVHDVMGRREIPIAQGASSKLPPAPQAGTPDPCRNAGVELLARELREGPATVIASGPLTDLACLARTDPVAAGNVVEVLAQVGARPGEPYDLNGRPALFSLNVGADPEAVRTVLSSPALAGATFTASPYHHAGGYLLDSARVDRLGGSSPEGVWLRDKARAFRAFWTAAFGDLGLRPWDQSLVYALMAPEEVRRVDVGWRLVDCSDPTGRNAGAACAGHGPTQFVTRDGEGQQLWLGPGPGQAARPRLQVLDGYAAPGGPARFLDTVTALRG